MGDSVYESLKLDDPDLHIRLVELEPSADITAPVRCTLRKARLHSDLRYSALSYVWGDPTCASTIYVNGVETKVTENLEFAMRRIRDGTSERVIWIDAICINQSDLAERSNQVINMGQIFGQAAKVLCWLGAAEDGFDIALASLDTSKLEASMSLTIEEGRTADDDFIEQSLNEVNCAALEHLASSPYWRRAWIVQEATLARELIMLYGSADLQWPFFCILNSLSATYTLGPITSVSPSSDRKHSALVQLYLATGGLQKMRDRQQSSSSEENDILNVLTSSTQTEASDLRDKIFGIYGLAHDSARFVTVDYTKSVFEVYESFVRRYIEQTQRLNIILSVGLTGPNELRTLSLPSWVPDWKWDEQTPYYRLRSELYSAAKDRKHKIEPNEISGVLYAQGILCDAITMFKSDSSWLGLEDFLFARGPNDYPTKTPRLQAMFRAITVDKYRLSDTRLNDDPDLWLLRLMMGFLTDLGMQANPLAPYAQRVREGVPTNTLGPDRLPSQETEDQIPAPIAHDFVLAFRDWAESCIVILDDMISGRRVPVPSADGCMSTKSVHNRVLALYLGEDQATMGVSSTIDHLLAWRESLRKTRDCSSMEDMLELFLGVPGASDTIPWPGLPVTGYEAYYWPRFHLTRGTVMGGASAFVTRAGYFASGPKTVRAGDVVCVLFGCDTPVVLRPVGNQYALVGPCYVEGLMDGEALDLVENGKAVESEFEIV